MLGEPRLYGVVLGAVCALSAAAALAVARLTRGITIYGADHLYRPAELTEEPRHELAPAREAPALCVNVSETPASREFSVEGGEAITDEQG